MAFNKKEQEIIRWGAQNGKSKDEVKEAIFNSRAGITPSKPEVEDSSFLQEAVGDISTGFQRAGEEFTERGPERIEEIRERDDGQGAVSSIIQRFGAGSRTAARALGEIGTGAIKALLPQQAEEAIASTAQDLITKIIETPENQERIAQYGQFKEKHPVIAANVEAALGVAELATAVTGAGQAAKTATGAAQFAVPAVGVVGRKFFTQFDGFAERAGQLIPTSISGIRQRAQQHVFNRIDNQVDELLAQGNLQRQTSELAKRGVDVREKLRRPKVFEGLKLTDGKIVPDEAIEQLQIQTDYLLDAKRAILQEVDGFVDPINKQTIFERAARDVRVTELAPADRGDVIRGIQRQLDALPDELNLTEWDKLRAKFRKSARSAKDIQKRDNPEAALENAIRDTIFDVTDDFPFDTQGQFASLNQEIRDNIATMDFINKSLRGRAIKGGRLGNLGARAVGAIAGSQGGPLGTILGSEAGGAIQSILMNNQLGNDIKLVLIREIADEDQILKAAQEILSKAKGTTRPLLESGTGVNRVDVPIEIPPRGAVPHGLGDEPSVPRASQ